MLKYSKASGGILLMSLVIFGMFSIMMIVSVNYINRQFKQTVHDEQSSKAFQVAEAGVHYSLWLLGEQVYTEQELHDMSDPIEREVDDPLEEGRVMGTFYITFERIQGDDYDRMVVTSKGKDYPGRSNCEAIETILRKVQDSTGTERYAVISWDHKEGCEL